MHFCTTRALQQTHQGDGGGSTHKGGKAATAACSQLCVLIGHQGAGRHCLQQEGKPAGGGRSRQRPHSIQLRAVSRALST